MKILYLVPYFHSNSIKPYQKFSTGLSFTLETIINESSALGHEVFVFAQSAFSKGYKKRNIVYLPKRIIGIFPISIRYIKKYFEDTKGSKLGLKYRIHVLSYYLFGKNIERIIRKVQPDIVSIRGAGFITQPYIIACQKTHTSYVVSLHGIFSLYDKSISENEKRIEQNLFISAKKENRPLTVISSGIKKRMLDHLKIDGCDEVYVVNNGIDYNVETADPKEISRLRKKLNILPTDKVIVSAGTICERKNQLQLLHAFHLLPEEIKKDTKLLFCGKGELLQKLKDEIVNLNEKNVIACGFIANDEMRKYYSLATVNAVVSLDEGFGRAFVEGFLNGVPALAFSDLDAVDDLYSMDAMIKVDNRTDKALMNGIVTALNHEWEKKSIIEHGKKFSIDSMVNNYLKIYKKYAKKH